MKAWVPFLATALLATTPVARAGGASLTPFVADYDVHYGRLSVGTSRTELLRDDAAADRWIIESRSTASGMARILAGGTLTQRSAFELVNGALRPTRYRFDDGTADTDQDVSLEFDWRAGTVRGVAGNGPVDVAAGPGLQDAASIQAYVLARLRQGAEPGTVPMIEKDRVRFYEYTLLRRERLKTAIGEFDTVVYRSARAGSGRETFFWFAPALDFALVQAEQRRDGKRGFHTAIRRYQQGG